MSKLDARPSARKSVELIELISGDTKEANNECTRFVRIVQKVQPFLKYILGQHEPQACPRLVHSILLIRFALQSLRGALREVVDESLRFTSAAELQDKVEKLSGDFAKALEQIPFDQVVVPNKIKSDIQKILRDIHYVSYEEILSGPPSPAQGQQQDYRKCKQACLARA